MGSRRIRGVRFRAISGDHAGGPIPHLHADIGAGEVVVELLPERVVRLSQLHRASVRGNVTQSERRRVLEIARDAFDELIALWEASQP